MKSIANKTTISCLVNLYNKFIEVGLFVVVSNPIGLQDNVLSYYQLAIKGMIMLNKYS